MTHRTRSAIENDIYRLKVDFDIYHLQTVHPLHRQHKLPAWRMLQDAVKPLVEELKATKQYEIDEFNRLHPEEWV